MSMWRGRRRTVTASNRKPNWTWEVAYGQRTGYSDMVSVGVSIPLPVAPGERQDRDTAARSWRWSTRPKPNWPRRRGPRLPSTGRWPAMRSACSNASSATAPVSSFPPLSERLPRLAAYRSNQGSLPSLFEARHAEVEASASCWRCSATLPRPRPTGLQTADRRGGAMNSAHTIGAGLLPPCCSPGAFYLGRKTARPADASMATVRRAYHRGPQGSLLARPDGAGPALRQARQVALHGHAAGAGVRRQRDGTTGEAA
jgi:hypothetical protein